MQVSSKTSMSNAIFHNLESGSNELQSGFSENQLKSRKLTHNVTLPNVEFRTSWCTTRSQNPSLVYSTPSELSAILCELCSQKSRFFLVQRNFPLYTQGVLGCLLGFWPSGPKPCRGKYKYINRAILANLQHIPSKFGTLIVLQETHLLLTKIFFSWRLTLFQSTATLSFSLKNIKQGHKLKLTYLYACWMMHMRHTCKYENGMLEMPLTLGRSESQYTCCHGNKTVKLILFSTFSRIFLQRIKHFLNIF